MFIYDIPIELLNLILLFTIHPYNNYNYLLLLVFRNKTIKNTIIEINKNRMICSICQICIQSNGRYCSQNNKPICSIHFLFCINCNSNVDIYQYSILFDKCIRCKNKLSVKI